MNLQIFDVAHGACALLTCDSGKRLMIDCGHNGSTNWKPGSHLKKLQIKQLDILAITNCDEDHVSGLPDLCNNVEIGWLLRNPSLTDSVIKSLKAENGIGYGIKTYIDMLSRCERERTMLPPDLQKVNWQVFYNNYPTFKDTNNLSMVIYLQIAGVNFLFPGDLESSGWAHLLKQEEFCKAVSETKVLIASHHGRENGIHHEIFTEHGCNPYYVVMSDKCHMHDTQKTVDYYSTKTRGGPFRGNDKRHVLTTRRDGSITFQFENGQWCPT